VLRIFFTLALGAMAVFAQPSAPPAALTFEVASIRPAEPITPAKVAAGKLHVGMTVNGTRVDIGFLSLADLIPMAYRVKSYQVSGPSWLPAQRFDIQAKMPPGATSEQVPEMLQALLADRFKLTIHRETKEHSMYALIVGKKGLKLKEAEPEPAPPKTQSDSGSPPDENAPVKSEDRPISIKNDGKGMVITGGGQKGQMRVGRGSDGSIRFESSKMTMEKLAETLSRFVDRPVVDMTELKGDYQVALEVSMEDLRYVAKAAMVGLAGTPPVGEPGKPPTDAASDPAGNSIFESVQKLGLKLEPRKGPIEIIVIVLIETAPTDN